MNLGPFYKIDSTGLYRLNVFSGAKKNYCVVTGNHELFYRASIKIKDGVLHISAPVRGITINVYAKNLLGVRLSNMLDPKIKSLSQSKMSMFINNVHHASFAGEFIIPHLIVNGYSHLSGKGKINIGTLNNTSAGTIIISGIQSKDMMINNVGSGKILLYGDIDAEQISQSGTGTIDIQKINGSITTVISSGTGKIKLAGKTKKLIATLTGKTFLNAKRLNAKVALIKTANSAQANINPLIQLFAYASGQSQINYYSKPPLLYRNTTPQGLILPML